MGILSLVFRSPMNSNGPSASVVLGGGVSIDSWGGMEDSSAIGLADIFSSIAGALRSESEVDNIAIAMVVAWFSEIVGQSFLLVDDRS